MCEDGPVADDEVRADVHVEAGATSETVQVSDEDVARAAQGYAAFHRRRQAQAELSRRDFATWMRLTERGRYEDGKTPADRHALEVIARRRASAS